MKLALGFLVLVQAVACTTSNLAAFATLGGSGFCGKMARIVQTSGSLIPRASPWKFSLTAMDRRRAAAGAVAISLPFFSGSSSNADGTKGTSGPTNEVKGAVPE